LADGQEQLVSRRFIDASSGMGFVPNIALLQRWSPKANRSSEITGKGPLKLQKPYKRKRIN
jgi:hypothetical protein